MRYVDTARLAALIDVAIEAEINSRAKDVRAMHKTQIVQHLRRGNPTRRSRRVDPRLAYTGKVKGRYIRPFRIGLALSKEETEATVTDSKFVDNARRDDPAVAYREIRCTAKHFALRWITGKDLRAGIQRITF